MLQKCNIFLSKKRELSNLNVAIDKYKKHSIFRI